METLLRKQSCGMAIAEEKFWGGNQKQNYPLSIGLVPSTCKQQVPHALVHNELSKTKFIGNLHTFTLIHY